MLSGGAMWGVNERWAAPNSLKLAQKPQVAVEKQAQIGHAVAQHGQAVGPHAKGKADVALGA